MIGSPCSAALGRVPKRPSSRHKRKSCRMYRHSRRPARCNNKQLLEPSRDISQQAGSKIALAESSAANPSQHPQHEGPADVSMAHSNQLLQLSWQLCMANLLHNGRPRLSSASGRLPLWQEMQMAHCQEHGHCIDEAPLADPTDAEQQPSWPQPP